MFRLLSLISNVNDNIYVESFVTMEIKMRFLRGEF